MHPSLGLSRLTEPMADKSLLGRLEKLLDLSLCKFFVESRLFLRVEISFPLMLASLDPQLDMPVIQRIEYLAEDIEKLTIACLLCDFGSVRVVLLFPVDIPQLKKWVSFVEGVPQRFEIPFRVANHDRRCESQRARAAEPRFWMEDRRVADDPPKQELMYHLT